MNASLRKWLVPGIPFLVSLGLSASTIGTGVFWQDSGFYLVAVKDLDILYPPGFVLYLLLCKVWTLLLFFVDFTLAVHLFSSFCAALAAGTLATAVRDLLRARGSLFKVTPEDAGPLAGRAGIVAGCLAASGFTFWFTGIYAKGYSLYYFIVALILWRMIRAAESGSRRDLTVVAALFGLSWAAHPSASLLGIAFAAFVVTQRKNVGLPGIAWRTAVAALCALGPSLFLPLMARKASLQAMGDPTDPGDFVSFLLGTAYTSKPGVFGWEANRIASFGQYLWEEFLGFGLLGITAGLVVLSRVNRRLLLGTFLWLVPHAILTILFKVEGQHDCWFVAGWLPLYLALGVGLYAMAVQVGRYAAPMLAGIAMASIAWASFTNYPDLEQRKYVLPEIYGRIFLEGLDPGAVLLFSGDDPVAICTYLQRIKGVRPDVVLVNGARLRARNRTSGDWYLDRLMSEYPFLKRPDIGGLIRRFGEKADLTYSVAAFLNENLGISRPLFTSISPAGPAAREELALVPAGALWKVVRKGEERTDPRYWTFPVTEAEVRKLYRRERAQSVEYTVDNVIVKPEGYERRLLGLLVNSRLTLASTHLKLGHFAEAARIYEGILEADPETSKDARTLYGLAHAYYGTDDLLRALTIYERVLQLTADPDLAAGSLLFLSRIHRKQGREERARHCLNVALSVAGVRSALREDIEREARRN